MATRKRKTVYPPARTDTKPAPRAGAGPEPYVRPTVATIDLNAGSGRAGLSVGDRVRIAGGGLYAGEAAVIEKLTPGSSRRRSFGPRPAGRARSARSTWSRSPARGDGHAPTTRYRMPTTIVDVPGGHLFAIDEGSGPPIVLLHAGVADLRAWDGMVEPLLSAGYRVVRFDTRGFGASTTEDVEFSPRDDLRAVMDSLGIGRAVLMGNSRGGMLALDTAIETPERIAAVVGVAAGLAGFDGESTPAEAGIEAEYERIDAAGDAAALTAFETRIWVDGPLQPAGRVPAPVRDLVYEMNLPLNGSGHVAGQEIPLAPAARDRLAELRCPVLAIAGVARLLRCRPDRPPPRVRGTRCEGDRLGRTSPT